MCFNCFGGGNKPNDDHSGNHGNEVSGHKTNVTAYREPTPYRPSPQESKTKYGIKNHTTEEDDVNLKSGHGKPNGGFDDQEKSFDLTTTDAKPFKSNYSPTENQMSSSRNGKYSDHQGPKREAGENQPITSGGGASPSPMASKDKTQQALFTASSALPTHATTTSSTHTPSSPLDANKEKTRQGVLPSSTPRRESSTSKPQEKAQQFPLPNSQGTAASPMRAKENTQSPLPTKISSGGGASPARAKEKTKLPNSTGSLATTQLLNSAAGASSPMRPKEKTQQSVALIHTSSPGAASPLKSKEPTPPSSEIQNSKSSTTRLSQSVLPPNDRQNNIGQDSDYSLLKTKASTAKPSAKAKIKAEETSCPETLRSDRDDNDANKR